MEYFHSSGGNNRPDFTYRFLMRTTTSEMIEWCRAYPLTGPFERFHIIHNFQENHLASKTDRRIVLPLIQFESRKAAYLFSIAYSEHILEDKTFSFAKDDTWTS